MFLCVVVGLFCFFFFLMIRRPPRSPLFPSPPLFRSLVSVTVPAEELPPVTLAGLTLTAASDAGGGTGVSVSVAERVTPANEPESATVLDAATGLVLTGNVADVAPARWRRRAPS